MSINWQCDSIDARTGRLALRPLWVIGAPIGREPSPTLAWNDAVKHVSLIYQYAFAHTMDERSQLKISRERGKHLSNRSIPSTI